MMRQAVPVNRRLGAFIRLVSAVLSGAVATTVLAGCAEAESMVPLEPVTDSSSRTQVQAQTQADRLVLMLQALEDRYTLQPAVPVRTLPDEPQAATTLLDASADPTEVPEQLSEHLNLDSQPRAFVQAQASYLQSQASSLAVSADTQTWPVAVTVEATDVAVVGSTPDGTPVARVMVATTSHHAEGPSTVTSAGYALSWAPGRNVDASGTTVTGPSFDGTRLVSIQPLYGQPDRPALDSGLGPRSPSNAVHTYVRAITHGSSANISSMEGTVRSSDDFRAVLKERLMAGPRYTVVELPAARLGAAHVLYVIQEDVPGALRLDVILGQDGPTVVPRL